MNEVEKLYENAGIEKIHNCKSCEYEEEYLCPDNCPHQQLIYPPFTAEKQLELIKLLQRKNGYKFSFSSTNDNSEYLFFCSQR